MVIQISYISRGHCNQGKRRCSIIHSFWHMLRLVNNCPICTRSSVSIVLLLRTMGGWQRWGLVDSYQGVGGGEQGSGYYPIVFFICAFVFWSLMSCLFFKWVGHDSCCVCFFVYYLISLSRVPLTTSYWSIEIVVSGM